MQQRLGAQLLETQAVVARMDEQLDNLGVQYNLEPRHAQAEEKLQRLLVTYRALLERCGEGG